MHDIRYIRENPDEFDRLLRRRGFVPPVDDIKALDQKRRSAQTEMQSLQQSRNDISKKIGEMKKAGDDAGKLMAEVSKLKDKLIEAEKIEKNIDAELNAMLEVIPNLPDPSIPDGQDETSNRLEREVGKKPMIESPKEHFDLGESLGLMDFETAAQMAGSRFVILKGMLATLDRALGNFMLDLHCAEFGYIESVPPVLVREQALFGTGQLPKFSDDLYKTDGDHWLIPTAEVPLTNFVAGKVLNASDLPLRLTAWTPCFRSEAGAAGKDTRGMLRQHQFNKVELVSVVHPEDSEMELERMTACAEEVLKRLGLTYRVMTLCTGDTGFSAAKTYDLEVWLPGQNSFREVSSCSSCQCFQARRLNARFKSPGQKGTSFVHTLNGSGLAVGRTLIAILENYQNPDGSITIPSALQPYLNGITKIEKD